MDSRAEQWMQHVPIDFVRSLGQLVLDAEFEEQFLGELAGMLAGYVGCDAVVLRLAQHGIEVGAVAARDGVEVGAPGDGWEHFTEEERRRWLETPDGLFTDDVSRADFMKPLFRRRAASAGAKSGFVVPFVHGDELHGKVLFGWSARAEVRPDRRALLRGVVDVCCYHLLAFWLRTAGQYDAVTGLRNRMALQRVWARQGRDAKGVLLFADLDGFKALVNARGHVAGDEFLREAARVLVDVAPRRSSVFRIGEDEFVLLAPGLADPRLGQLRKDVRDGFRQLAVRVPPPRPSVTVGTARYPDEGTGLKELLRLADERLLERRRRRVALSSPFAALEPASSGTVPMWLGEGGPDWVAGSLVEGAVATESAEDRASGLDRARAGDPESAGDRVSVGDRVSAEDVGAEPAREEFPMPEPVLSRWLSTWPDGILMTKPDLTVVYVNRMYEQMTGYSLQEWIGKKPTLVSSGKTSLATYEKMWDSLNERGTWAGHVINRRRDGTEWVSYLSIIRIVAADGELVGYLASARDVSHSVWKEAYVQEPFQEAFTQEALAFALAEAGQIHEGGSLRHLERMRDYTRLLVLGAMEKGSGPLQRYEERSAIVMASILHDIGKLAVPEGLLRKPARLTPQEFDLMKTHTVAGERLLRSPYLSPGLAAPESLFLEVAASIARSHHERWDGGGYPDGLAGDDIPLGARIVAIADVYDALRSSRAYKSPWTHQATVDYIAAGAGSQFDPDLVKIFLDLRGEFNDIAREIEQDMDVRIDGKAP